MRTTKAELLGDLVEELVDAAVCELVAELMAQQSSGALAADAAVLGSEARSNR